MDKIENIQVIDNSYIKVLFIENDKTQETKNEQRSSNNEQRTTENEKRETKSNQLKNR